MTKKNKDKVLTSVAIVLLLFTSLINWDIRSWLILVAAALVTFAWYARK